MTLTGPNTGGKTASLKALGLAAAMSKAGLFLPLQPVEGWHLLLSSGAGSCLVSSRQHLLVLFINGRSVYITGGENQWADFKSL